MNDSKFLSPTLRAETVAERVFEKVVRGESGFVVLPRTHEWLAMSVRAWPWWLQVGLSKRLKRTMKVVEERQREKEEKEGRGQNVKETS